MVVRIPKGATSGASDSIQPSRPNFDAAYAEPNSKPERPAEEEIEMTCPARWRRITGRTARVTFIGPPKLVASCRSICSGRKLFEVARVEAGRVVDQHIDATESVESGAHRPVGIGAARDVQLYRQQILRRSECLGHARRVCPVATTECPAASAALAKSTPILGPRR